MTTDLHLRLGTSGQGSEPQTSVESGHHLSFHSQLLAQIGEHLPAPARRELESLGREADAELFHEGLLSLAGRLERGNHEELALAIYQAQSFELAQSAELAGLRDRSTVHRDALLGSGDVGARAEVLARRFVREASNPSALIGMAGAQAVFGVTRMALLSRLAASPTASFLTRGAGARLAATTGAFMVEAPSFTAFTRLANAGLGHSQDWSLRAVGHEVASSYITLGALRASGALTSGAYRRLQGMTPGMAATPMQGAFNQAGMFGGILLGHEAETRLGLRQRVDGATTLLDSAVMLLQFNVAGNLLHAAAPGLGRMNQELHLRGDMASRPSERSFGNLLGPQLATANGAPPAGGDRVTPLDHVTMMIDSSGGRGSSPSAPPSEAISTPPPPGSGPRSIPPAPRRGGRTAGLIKGFQNLAAKFNWNAWTDVNRPLTQPPIERPSPTPRTVREGMLRAEALGQNRRALAFLRWGASQLRHAPEVQTQFLDLMQRVFEFQARQREALDPVLQGLPTLNFRGVNDLAAEYHRALERLTPGSGHDFAEARLLWERTREWNREEIFLDLSDTRLREVGIEPNTVHSIARNAHAFRQARLHRILEHPLLRDRPETATVRQAIDQFHTEIGQQREKFFGTENSPGTKADIARIRAEIASTEDVAQRQIYEQEIKSLSNTANIAYTKSVGRLRIAMNRFLNDSLHSRIFLVEAARQELFNRGLQDASRAELVASIRRAAPSLEGELLGKAQELLTASEQLDLIEARGPLNRAFHSAIRVFGFDSLPPLAVQRRYEKAMLELVDRLSPEQWQFEPLDRNAVDAATRAQSEYYPEFFGITRDLREGFRAIEKANEAFWELNEREVVGLQIEDLRLQLNQAESQFAQLGTDYWRSMKLNFEHINIANEAQLQQVRQVAGRTELDLRHGQQFRELKAAAESAIQNFTNPGTRGNNSRDAGRSLQVAAQRIAELRRFVRQSHDEVMIPGGDFRAVSALMLPFVDKVDASSRHNLRESLAAGWPILWRSSGRATALFSALERGETTAVMDRHFLNWSAEVAKSTNSSFVVDPNVRNLVGAEPVVAAGNHNSWLDFLQGGTPFARAAQLGTSASSRDAMRIGAKEGLGKLVGPVMERAIDLLTEPVADSALEYDTSVTNLARAMASGDLPGLRPGARSAAVYDELTMSMTSLVSPFAFDPYSAISSILSPPQGGRSFNIADRAAAMTGRPQNLLVTSSLNAYRLWPKPDRPLPLRQGPTVHATQFVPAGALMDFAAESNGRAATTRANLLRTLWLTLGTMPEYQREVPSITEAFAPFERPVDLSVETAIASRFRGIEELYPTAEGNRELGLIRSSLERTVRANQGIAGKAEENTRMLRDLELVDQVLESRTGQILRRRLTEIDLRMSQEDFAENVRPEETAGLRRLQRTVRARLKLLDQIEGKRANRQELSLTERRLLERMGASIAGRDNVQGRDTLIEQADYYFQLRDQGKNLRDNLLETQTTYYDFVRQWNERRRDPANPEHGQLHVSEAAGYEAAWQNYRQAVETTLNVHGVTPRRWEGQIFPDMVIRRDGTSTVVEPRGWQARNDFSVGALWRFIFDDTLGIVSVAKRLPEYDSTPDLYLTLHARSWGWRMLDRTQTRMRIENADNVREVASTPVISAPTHDGAAEFMNITTVLHDYGIRAFFMADRKFFRGTIRSILGPMDQYGHLPVDRGSAGALDQMKQAGTYIRNTGRSMIIFPGGTRNPIQHDERGNRVEGEIYGSRAGLGLTWETSGFAPVLPSGQVNGGIIYPRESFDVLFRRGVALGREYVFRFGNPVYADRLIPDNPNARITQLRPALVRELDRQFGELTGRRVGPPKPNKSKKR